MLKYFLLTDRITPVFKFRFSLLLACFFIVHPLAAQLCQGSLGDPVVNLHFGSGNNPGPPVSGINQYTYIGSGCPNDGQYTLANFSGACFGDTWHQVSEDHTPGDSKGYMMVINASHDPGTFFVDTVRGLCANTTFEFAAWIMNILKTGSCGNAGSRPDVTFTLETLTGTVLKSYSTGAIPESSIPEWKQYGFYFATPPGHKSVVLRMTNNAPGGCGNDLLIDDITFRACGPLVQTEVNGSITTLDLCVNNTAPLMMQAEVSAGYHQPAFQWQVYDVQNDSWENISGADTNVYTRPAIHQAGEYRFRMKVFEESNTGVSSCFVTSNDIIINVHKPPDPDVTVSGTCSGDTVYFNTDGGSVFLWDGPDGFQSGIANPVIVAAGMNKNGWYHVDVTDEFGCMNRDSVLLSLAPSPQVDAGDRIEICRGAQVQLQANATLATQYSWSPAQHFDDPNVPNPLFIPPATTLYTVQATNGMCTGTDTVRVIIYELPTADAGEDKAILAGDELVLNGAAGGSEIVFYWMPKSEMIFPDSIAPTVQPSVSRSYTLVVNSEKGCGTATDEVYIKVYQQVFVPNAFTPNNDGINDTWYIEALDVFERPSVKIYNRFGQVIFYNGNKNIAWDGRWNGTPVLPGAYIYVIEPGEGLGLIEGVLYLIR